MKTTIVNKLSAIEAPDEDALERVLIAMRTELYH
jgi:hypothetical protein